MGEGRLGTGREGEGDETKGRTEMKREGMSGRVEEIRERRDIETLYTLAFGHSRTYTL